MTISKKEWLAWIRSPLRLQWTFMNKWNAEPILETTGEHGSVLHVHVVRFGDRDTGIVMTWSRKHWRDYGIKRWYFRKVEYPDFNEAAYAWKLAGMPRDKVDYHDYLRVV